MQPFRNHCGQMVTLDRANVDTDQMVPKQFLKRIERTGFGETLFYDWRYLSDGTPNPQFEMNNPRFHDASILLTRENFGCGSSREHAVWAIRDYGIRVILAPSFADIFYGNCINNGILPVRLSDENTNHLFKWVSQQDVHDLIVDLEHCIVETRDGWQAMFQIEAYDRSRLLLGLDDIELTLMKDSFIEEYEKGITPYVLPTRIT